MIELHSLLSLLLENSIFSNKIQINVFESEFIQNTYLLLRRYSKKGR